MLDLSAIKKRNICFMGLMGSGKSIIGKELSKYLNLNFYDTDNEIELKTENEEFKAPSFIGNEITGINVFTNLSLTNHPFAEWKSKDINNLKVN